MMKMDYVVIFFFGQYKRQMDYSLLGPPTGATRSNQNAVKHRRIIDRKKVFVCVLFNVWRHSIIGDKKLFIRPGDDLKISV